MLASQRKVQNTPVADPDISYYHSLDPDTIFYKAPLKLAMPTYLRPLLYSVATFLMKIEDMVAMLHGKFGTVKINKPSTVETVHFWAFKVWWILYRVILPVIVAEKSIWQALAIFFMIEVSSGLVFGLFSQVNHVNMDCAFQKANEEKDWAITQIRTSVDYSHDSAFWTYMSGNLNHQVSHHLFPSINPQLYPAVSLIVKQVCQEYSVPYVVKPTFLDAVFNHFEQLDTIAKEI